MVFLIAWFAILFTGRYPSGMFGFVTGFLRYSTQVTCYQFLLTDRFPPFGGGSSGRRLSGAGSASTSRSGCRA